MTLQNQEPDITIRLLWDEEFTKWRWKVDVAGEEYRMAHQGMLGSIAQLACSTLDVVRYTPPPAQRQGACEGCSGQPMPGVRFPASPDGDTTLPWVQRCDTCMIYSDDTDAAYALSRYLGRACGHMAQYPDGPPKPFLYPIDKREP